ncbi:potassium voltage-gated channel subfamily D member 1 [Nematostella vectensis]|uniref:potassium voltage-gated channel subfamily D member 1 n=1 Tax=Nematostella vectensis TaxID=45351 RepID=UPI002076DA8A|nr:potassium voltage-gated channel subfamily D member 1 [Nematostella vectensis]
MDPFPNSHNGKRIEPGSKNASKKAMARVGETFARSSFKVTRVRPKRIKLNVGGYQFEILKDNLKKYPDTLLGGERKKYFYDDDRKEYFFDRDPIMFKYILDFYRTGDFHISNKSPDCIEAISDELAFFGIPKEFVSSCCCENIDFEHKMEEELDDEGLDPASFGRKEKLYEFLTNTKSSCAASMFSYFFVLVIVVNIIMINVETLECAISKSCGEYYENTFFIIDSFCVAVFTFEFGARLYSCPSRKAFIKNGTNVIDYIGILPYYIGIFEKIFESNNVQLEFLITALRIFRIFRVTKLARHSDRFMNLLKSIRDAAGELGGILFSFLALMIMFSSVIYFTEQKMSDGPPNKPSQFSSIPAAFWYTLVTMTTLGYGDIVPVTFLGKIIGSMCALIGVLLLALPVPIIEEKLSANTKRTARKSDAKKHKNHSVYATSKRLTHSIMSINRLKNRLKKRVEVHLSTSSLGNEMSVIAHEGETGTSGVHPRHGQENIEMSYVSGSHSPVHRPRQSPKHAPNRATINANNICDPPRCLGTSNGSAMAGCHGDEGLSSSGDTLVPSSKECIARIPVECEYLSIEHGIPV